MKRVNLEALETRRLLSALLPDVTWADDGYVSRVDDNSFLGMSGNGFLADHFYYGPDDIQIDEVRRYDANGRQDESFTPLSFSGSTTFLTDAAGRLYVGRGDSRADTLSLTRYTTAGKEDAGFGDNGTVTIATDPGGNTNPLLVDLATGPGGSVFVSTRSTLSGDDPGFNAQQQYFKLNSAGQLDTTWGDRGTVRYAVDGYLSYDNPILVDSKGRLIAQQDVDGGLQIVRYTADGKPDTTFGDNGGLFFIGTVGPEHLAIDAADRLVVLNQLTPDSTTDATSNVNRFDANGQPDTTFSNDGQFAIHSDNTFLTQESGALLLTANGTITVHMDAAVYRLRDNGRLDATFGDGGSYDLLDETLVGQLGDGSLLAYNFYVDGSENSSVSKLAPQTFVARGNSGTLYLTGTEGGEDFAVRPTALANRLAVTLGGEFVQSYDVAGLPITAIKVDLGDGNDSFADTYFTASSVPETVKGGSGNDTITTGGGTDSIDAGDGNDSVRSGAGTDEVDLGDGSNFLDAGTGGGTISTYNYDENATNTITGQGGDWEVDCNYGKYFVTLTGDSADVQLYGSDDSVLKLDMTQGCTLISGDGDDSITTGAGDDFIDIGGGKDTVVTGAGNDTVGGGPSESDFPQFESDLIDLGDGNDIARDTFGNNTLLGGDGDDTLRGGFDADSLDGGLGRDSLRGGVGNDTLLGGGGRDRLFGLDGDDSLAGGGNADLLVGGAGNDTLRGGAGDDYLIAGVPNVAAAATNVLRGNAGNDRYQTEDDNDVLAGLEERVETVV